MLKRRILAALATIIALTVLLLSHPFAAHSDNTLFIAPISKSSIDLNPAYTTGDALRVRAVTVNWSVFDPKTEQLSLNLFHDVTLDARLRRVDEMVNGGFVWVGDVEGEAGSSVTLSVRDGVLAGSIYRGGLEWGAIRYAGPALGSIHLVMELNPDVPHPDGPDYVIPRPPEAEIKFLNSTQDAACQEDGSEISVMVAYTPAARDATGGREAIEAYINQKISDMNSANDVSAAVFDWRLVHTMEVDYTESGSLSVDLEKLRIMGDGVLDEVHTARDTYMADLVALIVDQGNNNACGYAYQMSKMEPWFQDYSFAISALDYPGEYTCNAMTLAHEFGHNVGNAHDRDHASGQVLFPFSYGFQSPTGKFRDIMSYDCPNGCPRINHWSNPDVWYEGEPTGIDYQVDPERSADVVTSMNEARVLVSNFRADCRADLTVTPTEDAAPTDAPEATGTTPPTETPLPTETPTSAPTLTATSVATSVATTQPTITPDPSPTSEGNSLLPQGIFLPAVIRN